MGERVKVRFLKNYISAVGESISGAKDSYKVYPPTKALTALIEDGTLEIVKEGQAEKRETATVEAPETSAEKKKPAKE